MITERFKPNNPDVPNSHMFVGVNKSPIFNCLVLFSIWSLGLRSWESETTAAKISEKIEQGALTEEHTDGTFTKHLCKPHLC